MDRLLIDECLTPELVAVAKGRGLDAVHVTWLNLEGAADWTLASLAAERDYVIVTNNRRDFVQLCAQMDIHNGIIIVPLGKKGEAMPSLHPCARRYPGRIQPGQPAGRGPCGRQRRRAQLGKPTG